ncbi:hypothetical protein SAY86_008605 [Trapa natans]|uniref:Kiwellin n=1 Tax=Trapa natans TaxID=22666 RepID=A0AAN7KAH1_TRANT|nr:hypothetical protein SAY86_008605 [Trapa natans]
MERAPTGTLMVATVSFFLVLASLPCPSTAISYCGGPCRTLNDCNGQLICINGRCADDPDIGTHICRNSPPPPRTPSPPSDPTCRSSGNLNCKGIFYPQYTCSPPVTTSTPAILTENDFSPGGEGGYPSECDGHYHANSELIVALSTGWYAGGSRCGRKIRITSLKTGLTTTAKVVDECDSVNGCDAEHAGQPPCRNNIVDGSSAVWKALGLNIDVGEEKIVWSMV